MSTTTGAVVALGETDLVIGFAGAGVRVVPAGTAAEARTAWGRLTEDVGLVVLTPAAAAAVGDDLRRAGPFLSAVMPS
jgi:vacuolar-type H+-ATPase subunit F/Vma7